MSVPSFRQFRVLLVLLAGILPMSPLAVASEQGMERWEYRWGDSPFTPEGVPEWTLDGDSGEWQSIDFPSNPPNRMGREHVWFRVTLPEGRWSEPVLYIYSVDLIFEVYFEGRKIYQYGTFDEQGRGHFEGWPWHAIPLPGDFAGKPMYFRVFSNYTDIGLWGEVRVTDRPDLTLFILKKSVEALVVSGFSALIALLAIIFALGQTEKKSYASIALFSLSTGTMLLAESQASQLLWHAPLFWDYLAAGSYFMIPVAMALLLEQWFTDRRPQVINLVWKVHLLYLVSALGLSLAGVVDLSSTFPVFDGLLLVSLGVITTVMVRRFHQINAEQKIILLAYGVFSGLLVVDMAVAHGFLPWGRVPVSWGALLFSLAIVMISLWHYSHTQQALRLLNINLERQVAERTEKAEALARREQARVRMLTFENEKTRVLNDIIAELQNCISVNQGFAVLIRAMPDLCSPLRGSLYQRATGGNGYERVCHWGFFGEDEPARHLDIPNDDKHRHDILLSSPWRLPINLQSAKQGTVLAGLLFLDVPESMMAERHDYGVARLFNSLDQGIQKIGITLSSISLREELQRYSYEDALTSLKNRRYFDDLLEHESAVALRSRMPLSVLIADIDHFKRFNDTYGHEAGDSVLKTVASVLLRQFRESDVVCRFGGEEFVVIMPGASLKDARERGEALLAVVRATPIYHEGAQLNYVTLSAGIATWPDCGQPPKRLLGLADRALYRAKDGGRDRVDVCGD